PSRTAFLFALLPWCVCRIAVIASQPTRRRKKVQTPPGWRGVGDRQHQSRVERMKRGPGSDDKAACRSIENDLMECWRSNSRLRSRCDSRKQDFSTFTLPRASHIRGLYILFRARFVTTRSTHGPLTGHPRYEPINTEPNRVANKQRTAVVACSQMAPKDRPRCAARKAPGLNVEIRKTRKQKVMAWLLPAARAIR
ncbi:hypothetical protein CSPX01_13246, partial [Colletotrichum filicis]